MTYQPINTGLSAFGMSGRIFHAPFLYNHPGFRFSAITERHQKKANQIYPDVKSYDTIKELIEDPKLELIIINTPNDTHFEYAKRVLLAGKHVLIEKPCTTSVAETRELFELANIRGRYVMAYQNRRWDSDFLSVREVIESGKLGELVEVHLRYDRYRPIIESKAFKESPVIPGSGLAYNLGPHLLDQAISLWGKPLKCQKTTASKRIGSKVDDYAFFHLTYLGNLNVYVHISLLVARPLPAYVIHGTKGTYIKDRTDIQESQLEKGISPFDKNYGIEIAGGAGELTLIDGNNIQTTELVTQPKGNYTELFDAVYGQIRNHQSYPIKNEQLLWQIEILEQ